MEDTDYSDIEQGRLSQILQQLHQVLIQPIADLLPTEDTAKVIFMPQGSLFLIPFPALKDYSNKYLIEKHTILTAPSIQVLELTRQQQATVQQAALQEVLVLGNPTMPLHLRPLPGAEEEAIAIANLLQTQAITGGDGTKERIVNKMLQAKIIHLATHGLLDNDRGLGSAIALAPSDNDNGLLTAEEILDLNLKAELVVLSACDTGRGRLTGDGVIGLSRSFISAGVPSVLVSLWAIPDAPTASLMTEFYRTWQQQPDKAVALRQAMLVTMQQHPNPRDWAAFIIIGEAE
ncbi:CHAT domain-containing protein [Nostoc favosum]|uniref:CHAT domain-containing protein n=1 Tax=Nostoc favosum TaxID=2907819 RepID=UPI002811429E|nr:CHAT domain-containing protein [Nostoc favosum]